jgi:hypothetical protein
LGDKLLQGKGRVVGVTTVIQGLGLANLPGGQDLALRTGMHLVGRWPRQGGQRVPIVVPD